MERLVSFKVLGQEYPLYTDAPEEDLQEILLLVKAHLEDARIGPANVLPTSKQAIVTCLNIATKYVRVKREFEEYRQLVEMKINRLAERIEDSI